MDLLTAAAGLDGPILEDRDGVLTAGDLRRRAAGLAAALSARGLRPGDRVVLSGPRSARSLVSLYACWHGGFVAAPVEPGLPPARLGPILRDCEPSAIVAVGPRANGLLRAAGGAPVVVSTQSMDGELPFDVATSTPPRPPTPRGEDDLASLHFTSGSTGRARGVPYTRRGVDLFVAFWSQTLALGPDDRVVWAFPMAYAPSLIPLGAAVGSGAVLSPLSAGVAALPDLAEPALRGASVLLGVPSLLASLLRTGALAGLPLRAIVMAGEPVPAPLAEGLRAALPGARILNLYGTTECNGVAVHEVTGPVEGPLLPAGRPIPYMDVLLLDEDGAPAREGEVVVAGPTVMSGYWGDAAGASWAAVEGRRYYRSGDLGRWDSDSVLHLLGRADRQVKLGGHRVELGAVEAALAAVPGVEAAAVVAAGEGAERVLIAWVVGIRDPQDVLDELSRELPAYALPLRVERLDALPLGPRGKVDLTALRARAGVIS